MNKGWPSLDPVLSPVFPGSGYPPVFEHPDAFYETSDRDLRLGPLVQFERLGFKQPTAQDALDPAWGLSPHSTVLDYRNQFDQPYASSEIVRRIDIQRCIEVDPDQITPAGVAFELVHWRVPVGAVCVLEQIPTIWDDVSAIDDDGEAFFSYAGLNGERLCRSELQHPDPAISEPLRWRFHLTFTDDPSREAPTVIPDMTYLGPVLPAEIQGHPITPPWSDARYGANNRWAELQQFLAPSSSIVRFWVTLSGPVDRFRVRVGARLGGFVQHGGRRGAALDAVQIRRV